MFIHIGNNIIVSDSECIGIFNVDTLKLSPENEFFLKDISTEDKLISIDKNNNIASSWVSPFTVIKREAISNEELIWSRKE